MIPSSPVSYKLLDPREVPWANNNTIFQWRQYLKETLAVRRKFQSDYSGKSLHQCHMHESLIPRSYVPKSIWWHYFLFHEINSVLLLPEEHIPEPPSREWAVLKAVEYYGEETVVTWFNTLPWKNRPYRIEAYLL